MHGYLHRIVAMLELIRAPLALSAVSNAWVMIHLAQSIELSQNQPPALAHLPLWAVLLAAAAAAGGLHGFGLAFNDLLHARQDRVFQPQRPIPAGRVHPATAAIVGLISLLMAVLGAAALGPGATVLCVLAAATLLFYNAAGRFIPAIGIVTLALVRAAVMLMPGPTVTFIWPIILTMTHAVLAMALIHHIEGKRPQLQGWAGGAICGGWMFWTLTLVATTTLRGQDPLLGQPLLWAVPAAAAVAYLLLLAHLIRRARRCQQPPRRLAHRLLRLSLCWLIVYDAAWLLGAGLPGAALLHLGLLALAVALDRLPAWIGSAEAAPRYRLAAPSAVE